MTGRRRVPGLLSAALRGRIRLRRDALAGQSIAALVVGGDACQQRFCVSFLQTLGVEVEVATCAQSGLNALARARYRLVIVDARTRGFDAGAWAKVLAATSGDTSPVLYVVTDEGRDGFAGACQFIERPVRAIHLVRAVEKLAA